MRRSYLIASALRYVRCAVAESDVQPVRVLCGATETLSLQARCSRCDNSLMHTVDLKPLLEAAHR